MSHSKLTKSFAVLLSVLMVLTVLPLSGFAIDFKEVADGNGIYLVSDTKTPIAPGITENKIITNDQTNNAQVRGYAVSIDPNQKTVGFRAGYADMKGDTWKMTTVRAQAAACEKKYGENVVAAFNADIYNMANGEPTHVLVMNGKVYKSGLGGPYVGITKDGELVIGNQLTQDVLNNLQEAVGGFYTLLENGVRVNQDRQSMLNPKTAIGKKANGEIVIYAADGRDYPNSVGLSDYDLTTIMMGLGCVDVLNFDGGGSTTYLAKVEGSDKLSLRNRPSDGPERTVSSSFFVTSSAKPTGVFDHANLEPNNEIYTPNSTVKFSAIGVDSSGTKTDLPSDGVYALAADSESFGSITEDGVFKSNGKTGTVTVNYISEGAVSGSTSIEVQNPDTMYFTDEEISLGFEAESTLGLVVKYNGRDVNYTASDIVFKLSNPSLGHFDGLTFISSANETVSGTISAYYALDENLNCSIRAIIGKLPTIVWDFEDVEETNEEGIVTNTIPAEEYYNSILTHSNYSRGGKESFEIVSINDEEPVRFGSHSLKLNYDFINCGAVTEGACIGTTDSMTIPGNPSAIGVWVYAPEGVGITYNGEGQAGFWLRGYVSDGSGTNQAFDYTLEPKQCVGPDGKWNGVQPGISWEGWMYCEADLGKYTGPFSIQPGMTFRLMYVAGTQMGTKSAGSVYFDNLQFVYGTNVDDIDNPIIDSITANDAVINDGDVINTNTVTFDSYFHDVQNKYATGIDAGTVRMYIDGINTADNDAYQFVADPDGTRAHLYDTYLLNGRHSITVSVRDGFGNETSETRYFTVKGEETDVPTVSVVPKEETAVIGKTLSLEIKASDASAVTQSMTGITVGKQFKNYDVSFADGFTGTYKYNKLTDIITVEANGNAKDGNDVIATVTFDVPETLNSSAEFSYTVKAGSYTVDGTTYTYSTPAATIPVSALYVVTADPIIVGNSGTLHVETADGKPASGITLYYEGSTTEVLGVTDENGDLVTDRFSSQMGNYIVYAKDSDGLLSFRLTVGSYDAMGTGEAPYGIMSNATKDPSSMQSITWMSNPKAAGKQTLSYRAQGTQDWTTVKAKSKTTTFSKGSNAAVSVNGVVLEGLDAGTTYEYTVGGEETRSDIKTFTTTVNDADVSFFVLGDVQAEDLTNINAITNIISEQNYDFGIQTGDTVDDPTSYKGWVDATDFLGEGRLGGVDVIHVLGNHEYAGDADAERAKSFYTLENSKAGGYYSVTYGNVYVAVINYSGSVSQYRAALDRMVKDAKASDAQWKVLSIHQPAYFTNITGGNNDVHALVPAAVEEAGIDVVFSGHDHAYARTKPMIGGEVNEDGVVYFIAGSSGEKSYTATNTPEFNFDIATNDYTSIYMSVTANKEEFSVNTYDISVNGDGSVNTVLYDSYTIDSQCKKNGHEWFHDSETDNVTCSVCGMTDENYTGFAKDSKTDKTMYYTHGNKVTGWIVIGEDAYYFDENGLGVTGRQTIDGITYEFTEEGKQSTPAFHKDSDGETRCYVAGEALHGWQFINGYYYYLTADNGRMLANATYKITFRLGDTGKFTFDRNGRLTSTTVIVTTKEGDKMCYYGPEILTGWQSVDGTTYYFDVNSGVMVTGEAVIDGEIFEFSNEGKFLHEGPHNWSDDTCTICRMNKDGSFANSGFFGSILDFFRSIIFKIIDFFANLFR